MNITCLKLPPHGITVIWDWEWSEDPGTDGSFESEDPDSLEQNNPYLHSDSDDSQSDVEFSLPTQTHTVTFKCIGSTYDQIAQESLSKASKLLRNGTNVQTKLQPEPTNQYDNRAIAFMCYVDNKWQRIRYVVRECLEHVHKVLSGNQILSVKLCWAKYLVCWARSGPSYYAGINISIRGEWHRDVVHSQSTR